MKFYPVLKDVAAFWKEVFSEIETLLLKGTHISKHAFQ